jgi:hypothetical protein
MTMPAAIGRLGLLSILCLAACERGAWIGETPLGQPRVFRARMAGAMTALRDGDVLEPSAVQVNAPAGRPWENRLAEVIHRGDEQTLRFVLFWLGAFGPGVPHALPMYRSDDDQGFIPGGVAIYGFGSRIRAAGSEGAMTPPSVTAVAALEHLLVFSERATAVQLFDTGGAFTTLDAGLTLLHRPCSAERSRPLEALPLDAELSLFGNQLPGDAYVLARSWETEYFAHCAASLPAETLGRRIAPQAAAMVWSPSGESLYYVEASADSMPRRLDVASFATGASQLLANGSFSPSGELTVSADGSALFAPLLRTALHTSGIGRISLDGSPPLEPVALAVGSRGLLSPDGFQLAVEEITTDGMYRRSVILLDVASGARRELGEGEPLAWSPDGRSLLVNSATGPRILGLDGAETTLRSPGINVFRIVWPSDGPYALGQTETSVDAARYADRTSRSRPRSSGMFDVEGGRRGLSVAWASQSEALFYWSTECLGLDDAHCTASLHRWSFRTDADDVVAVGRRLGLVAVSPDAQHLAVSVPDGLFIRAIP